MKATIPIKKKNITSTPGFLPNHQKVDYESENTNSAMSVAIFNLNSWYRKQKEASCYIYILINMQMLMSSFNNCLEELLSQFPIK